MTQSIYMIVERRVRPPRALRHDPDVDLGQRRPGIPGTKENPLSLNFECQLDPLRRPLPRKSAP